MKASDNPYPSILFDEETDPAAPAAGHKRLFIDSADHKLKTIDSSSVLVELGASTGGGALVLLEQHTASSSASLDFTTCISATYDDYMIRFINLKPASDNVSLYMRVSTDGGSNFDTGNNYTYNGLYNGTSDTLTALGSSGAAQHLIANSVSTSANWSVNGDGILQSPGSALYKPYRTAVQSPVGTTSLYWWETKGLYLSTTAVNAFQFLFSSGNIASGTIRVYGIAKS